MTTVEIGKNIVAAGIATNYHEVGSGPPIILLHGSGPGVSAWANWSHIMPRLGTQYRVLAPDIVGFGSTERPAGAQYSIKRWVGHLIGFLDALKIDRAVLVGNSFGGGISLAASLRFAERIAGMVLMGTPAGEFPQSEGLAAGWHYEPSLENMERLLKLFPFDPGIVTPAMVKARYEASLLHGGQGAVRKLQPEPAPAGTAATVQGVPESALATITVPTLALHGRDDKVVPMECALRVLRCIPRSELHLFADCGHWVQIEREDAFVDLVINFAQRVSRR